MYLPSGHGYVHAIVGPMFSEKTTFLISTLKKHVIGGQRVMVFKPDIDDRYHTDNIVTHDGEAMHANSVPCSSSATILKLVTKSVDVVGIDEGQFFDEGLVEVVQILADKGIVVVVAGLDMDYRCEPFKPMNDIMSIAEIVTKLTAVCAICGKPATKIQRFTNGKLSVWDEPTVAIGSNRGESEYQYEARCRGCYTKPIKLIDGGIR